MRKHGVDPGRLLAKGTPVFSLWFHMTDPTEMMLLQGAILLVTFFFFIGLCTRLTSVLTWFAFVGFAHRNPYMLFGVDVMTNIMLLYLMIGPSGAALSVDRLIARRLRSSATPGAKPQAVASLPEPTVSANLAVRLVQVHLCIIYFIAGVSKLMGPTWWNGTAVWGTIAHYEYAPMQYEIYNVLLRFLAHNELVFHTFLFLGTYFTLAFEIGYAFLIWNRVFGGCCWLRPAAARLDRRRHGADDLRPDHAGHEPGVSDRRRNALAGGLAGAMGWVLEESKCQEGDLYPIIAQLLYTWV